MLCGPARPDPFDRFGVPPGPRRATALPEGREPTGLTRRETRLGVSVRSFVGHDVRNPVPEPIGIEDLSP